MTYQEWIHSERHHGNVFDAYPKLKDYLYNKYCYYELKYNADFTYRQILALIVEYENVLTSIEQALKIRRENPITIDNLGKVSKTIRKDNSTNKGIDSTNYVGYNVEGEFEKENKSHEFNRNLDDKNTEFNMFEQLIRMESQGKRLAWSQFEKAFLKLFITIYPLVF